MNVYSACSPDHALLLKGLRSPTSQIPSYYDETPFQGLKADSPMSSAEPFISGPSKQRNRRNAKDLNESKTRSKTSDRSYDRLISLSASHGLWLRRFACTHACMHASSASDWKRPPSIKNETIVAKVKNLAASRVHLSEVVLLSLRLLHFIFSLVALVLFLVGKKHRRLQKRGRTKPSWNRDIWGPRDRKLRQ